MSPEILVMQDFWRNPLHPTRILGWDSGL